MSPLSPSTPGSVEVKRIWEHAFCLWYLSLLLILELGAHTCPHGDTAVSIFVIIILPLVTIYMKIYSKKRPLCGVCWGLCGWLLRWNGSVRCHRLHHKDQHVRCMTTGSSAHTCSNSVRLLCSPQFECWFLKLMKWKSTQDWHTGALHSSSNFLNDCVWCLLSSVTSSCYGCHSLIPLPRGQGSLRVKAEFPSYMPSAWCRPGH